MNEPILNREEIAQLVASIRSGEIPLNGDESSHDGAQFSRNKMAAPLDLFNIDRADKDQVRIANFDIIVDTFSRHYSTTLTNNLQRTFTIRRVSLETRELEAFMAQIGNSGAIGVFDMAPLPSGALVIYDNQLAFSTLEIMLGAANDIESPLVNRQLTTLETNLIKSMMQEVVIDLKRSFAQVGDIDISLLKVENSTRLISIAEPDAEVIVANLQVLTRREIGHIWLVFPMTTLDPLRSQLKELLKISSHSSNSWRDICTMQLNSMPLTIIAQSGEITMTVRELIGLQQGDILELGYDPNSPLRVLVESRHKFNAIAGTHNGNKAISLTQTIENQ